MAYDLVLRGGTVLDGTGAAGRTADVAVRDGRIVDVGQIDGVAAREFDVSGAVVSPGFIDLHSHADFTVFGAPEAVTQATQGVTTLVTGNCGFSPFPIVPENRDALLSHRLIADAGAWDWSTAADYADAVDALALGVNLALQVGHGALRIAAMGLDDRAPTDTELTRMRELVRQCAQDGVVGFSTGLIYAPGMFGTTDEVVALASEAAAAGLLYSTHIRNEGTRLAEAVDEALTIARRSGVRLEISHLKASGVANWGSVRDALATILAARREGVDVGTDQYPYTASSTTLTAFLPGWAMDGGTPELLRRLADESESARLVAELTDHLGKKFWPERIVIASTPDGPYQSFVGQSVTDFAKAQGLEPAEGTVELLRGQGGRVGIIHHSMSEDDVRHVMSEPLVSVASDGATLECPGDGKPHPRSFGTFVRVLGHYVRDENVLALPDAIRKMTSQPASRLGWTDRGVIRPGAVADLAVFDPDEVADQATFEDPWQLATGVRYTLLAGVPVLEDGQPTNAGAGQVIRRSRDG
jgi:N-acyl-D-amino-acid deacylase